MEINAQMNNLFLSFKKTLWCSNPVLSTEQYDELPDEEGRVLVQKLIITRALQSFVLGELYNVHLVSLIPVKHIQSSVLYSHVTTLNM